VQLPGDTCWPTSACEQPSQNCQQVYLPPSEPPYIPPDPWPFFLPCETDSLEVVEDFKATVTQGILDICWWGAYIDHSPAEPYAWGDDDFTIHFYVDSNSDGYPDEAPIASYSQSAGTLLNLFRTAYDVVALTCDREALVYEYAAHLDPPFEVIAGNCYFIGFSNVANPGAGTSTWFMATSQEADGYLLWGSAPWNGADLVIADTIYYDHFDAAFCIDQPLDPDPGSCVYNVQNDECTGAIEVFCGDAVNADNGLATVNPNDPDVLNESSDWSACILLPIFADNTVWYRWVATGDSITVKTCSTTGAHDTVAGIFRLIDTGEPCTGNLIEAFAHSGGLPDFQTSSTRSCGDPPNHAFFCPGTLVQGETYYIMVGSDPDTVPGAFTLEIVCDTECAPPPTGACCQPDETCCPTPDDPAQRMTASQCLCDPLPPCTFGTAWFQDQACEDVACPTSFCGEPGFCQFFTMCDASYSDDDHGQVTYDDLIPAQTGSIAAICWDGVWLLGGQCDPPSGNFRVAYYPDNGSCVPDLDNPIASFTTNDPPDYRLRVSMENTGQHNGGVPEASAIYQITASHPAVPVEAGTCYWIEIAGLNDECVFLWNSAGVATGGNGRNAIGPADHTSATPVFDDLNGDSVFCIDLGLVPGSCPPCVGACCLQDPPSCVELEFEAECALLLGVWRGLGTSCDDPDIDCSVGACCPSETECTQTVAEDCVGPACTFCDGPAPVCFGDVNGDGAVDPQDVGLIKYYYPSPPTPEFQEVYCRCDLNCDGTINPADVGLCKYFYADPCLEDPENPGEPLYPPLHLTPPGDPNHCPAYYFPVSSAGEFYGYGTVCPAGREDGAITCDCICPDCALHECTPICDVEAAHDPPDPDCNGGCNEPGPPYTAFDPIENGNTICGTAAIVDDPSSPGYVVRDMDWFSFSTVDAETYVTWSVWSDFCAEIFIFEADCEQGSAWGVTDSIVQGVWPGECVNTVLELYLPAGDWYTVVAPDFAGNDYALPCTMENNRYYATLTFAEFCPDGHTGQPPDMLPHGAEGKYGAISDTNAGVLAADDFMPITGPVDIASIAWWGSYYDPSVPAACVQQGGNTPDSFTVKYYTDAAGLPGVEIATFAFNWDEVDKTWTGRYVRTDFGDLKEYRYQATHDPVNVDVDTCYWIEIANHTTGDCYWLWSTAPPGDNLSARDPGSGYAPKDYDLAWCLDIDALGCQSLAACCVGEECAMTMKSDCLPGGDWYAREACTPDFCSFGACCAGDPVQCTEVRQIECLGGSDNWYLGETCTTDFCEPGACCAGDPVQCTEVRQIECPEGPGAWYLGETCTSDFCEPGACCALDLAGEVTECLYTNRQIDCDAIAAPHRWYLGQSCPDFPCEPLGACCNGETCQETLTEVECDSTGDWYEGKNCEADEPLDCRLGACCVLNIPSEVTECLYTNRQIDCDAVGAPHRWYWPGTCPDYPCEPLGAWCNGETCQETLTEVECDCPGDWYPGKNCEPDHALNCRYGACCDGTDCVATNRQPDCTLIPYSHWHEGGTCPAYDCVGWACPDAVEIACGGVHSFDTDNDSTANDADDPDANCNPLGPTEPVYYTAWFKFTWDGSQGTTATLSTCNAPPSGSPGNLIAVYTGDCGPATLVEYACAADGCGGGTAGLAQLGLTGLQDGQVYYVMIGHPWSGHRGAQTLGFTCP
jgi:hypothetical protein